MTRIRSKLVGVGLVVGLAWFVFGRGGNDDDNDATTEQQRTIGRDFRDAIGRSAKIPWTAPDRLDGNVTIAGKVVDTDSKQPVGNVEVVFRSAAGEETTIARADGRYEIDVPIGSYRVFVRDDTVLSVGPINRIRLPAPPDADAVGAPDEALMPLVAAVHDTEGVDLGVLRGGIVVGKVVDRAGRPIKHAVLRALGPYVKPALGTDLAETDDSGAFELRLPPGSYDIEATHPRYAGLSEAGYVSVIAGERVTANLTLTAGCVIAGRVVRSDGGAAGDGAIELQWGEGDLEFKPDSKIAADGSFRWVTTREAEITLRAWPWKSPPSPSQKFGCRDGARFDNVVFALPNQGPDIEGLLVDKSGAPVPFAYIDLQPRSPGGIVQQERTDSEGKWAVFHMPVGEYGVTAYAPNLGIVSTTVSSPQRDVKLTFGGTGKLAGTTDLENGSFDLHLVSCIAGGMTIEIPDDHRLVSVTNGTFEVDNVPACELSLIATSQHRKQAAMIGVTEQQVSKPDFALAPPRLKHVTGTVRDKDGRPVEASVTATYSGNYGDEYPDVTVTSDASGRFALDAYAGASLNAATDTAVGYSAIGNDKVDHEHIDIVLEHMPEYDSEPEGEP